MVYMHACVEIFNHKPFAFTDIPVTIENMSDFLARKVKTFFKQMDLNHDGYVSLKDFVDMAERHCDTEKADAVEREKTTGSLAKVSYLQR